MTITEAANAAAFDRVFELLLEAAAQRRARMEREGESKRRAEGGDGQQD